MSTLITTGGGFFESKFMQIFTDIPSDAALSKCVLTYLQVKDSLVFVDSRLFESSNNLLSYLYIDYV